jgi:hypothetical protein
MRSLRELGLAAILALTLGGCSIPPPVTPSPAATYIGVAPAYSDLAFAWLAGFGDQDPLHELTLLILPTQDGLAGVEAGELAFMITSAEPPADWFATPLSKEPILVAVSPGVAPGELDPEALNAIFAGRVHDWADLDAAAGPVQPIVYPAGDELRQSFARQVMGNSRITSNALLAPDPTAMGELLMNERGAIGFLPGPKLPSGLKPLDLAGAAPSRPMVESGRYPLTVTILAVATEEPAGLARTWLGWIQAQADSLQP